MLNYAELRNIQRKEMESSEVTSLDNNFYTLVAEFLTARKKEAITSKSIIVIREYENIRKIVFAIQSRREEKIVLMAVRGIHEGKGLTENEKIMLKDLASIIEKSRSGVKDAWNSERIASDTVRVKMLRNIEQYRGKDDLLYGPFKGGEERLLPPEEAKWLLQVGMAAEV
jgi:DNA replication initiation complex subunit (GINS family)